jgi:hypothetical protein
MFERSIKVTLICLFDHTANHLVGDLVKYATNKKFTHLVILTEKQKACNGWV